MPISGRIIFSNLSECTADIDPMGAGGDRLEGRATIDGKTYFVVSDDGLDWRPEREVVPYGEIVKAGERPEYFMRTDGGWRRLYAIGETFVPSDDLFENLDHYQGIEVVYAAPHCGSHLEKPVQVLAFPDGSRFKFSSGLQAVKDEDFLCQGHGKMKCDDLTNESIELIEVVFPKDSNKGLTPLKDKPGYIITEDPIDQLHAMLRRINVSDDAIASGVTLNDAAFQKIASKFGMSEADARLTMAKLKARIRNTLNEERYSYEKDFLGNISVVDGVEDKSKMFRGSHATDILNRLKHDPSKKQEILASALTESETDHWKAKEETGFYGRRGAGCIILARSSGRILLNHRSKGVEEPDTWGNWGGAIDANEDPHAAVLREIREEAGNIDALAVIPLFIYRKGSFTYHNFLVVVEDEFSPRTNWESQGHKWCEYGKWPEPLHFGLKSLFSDHASVVTIQSVIKGDLIKESVEGDSHGMSGAGSYNFPWKVGNERGLATARYSSVGSKIKIEVIDVRDMDGESVDADGMIDDIETQALAFIGKE